jgi:hypothetical protein
VNGVPQHLDPDTLAALSEKSLAETETAAAFAHLAECGQCRDWFEIFCERPARATRTTNVWFRWAAGACVLILAGLASLAPHFANKPAAPISPKLSAISWIFASDIARANTYSTLPAPLASTRLGRQTTFLAASPEFRPKFGNQAALYCRVSLKTNLGVKWVSLRLVQKR